MHATPAVSDDRPPAPLAISDSDLQAIELFRRSKNTAVLTILFTDIQGFTRLTESRGESHSNQLRHTHDALVIPVIEQDGTGKVIKQIGDAVMAVFAEPSAAVARALAIQRKLAQHNAAQSDPDNQIHVRIGLHSGQVTTEDRVNFDVFGRHVNRASRVEALAQGGQILVTYPVYDSAKGWVTGAEAAWTHHGAYSLKGIPEPIAIYEVYDPALRRPHAPPGAQRASAVPLLVAAVALLVVGALAVLGFQSFRATKVVFRDFQPREPILNGATPLVLSGAIGDPLREALIPIPPGRHVLHYDVSSLVRYYAEIDVQPGDNFLAPRFSYNQMPSVSRHVSLEDDQPFELTVTQTNHYRVFDGPRFVQTNWLVATFTVRGEPVPPDAARFRYDWNVTLNGAPLSRDSMEQLTQRDDSTTHRASRTLHSDPFHTIEASYYAIGPSTAFSIQGSYVAPTPP